MKKFVTFFILYILNIGMNADAQLFHCIDDSKESDKAFLKEQGFRTAYIFDGRYLDADNDGKLDVENLQKAIEQMIPIGQINAIGVIDWEGQILQDIYSKPVCNKQFKKGRREFLKAIKLAKKLRPSIQWSFYAIPFSHYWVSDSLAWAKANKKIKKLVKACDVLTPSLYDFYPDANPQAENERYYRVNLEKYLQVASRFNKKIYPFIWHRWHDSNAKDGLQLLPESEFEKHMNWIFNTRLHETEIAGVIWFSADAYYKNIKPQVYKAENTDQLSFEKYYSKTIAQYAEILTSVYKNRSDLNQKSE